MNKYYFSECGNFKLCKSEPEYMEHDKYWSKSVGTGKVKRLTEIEFNNLKGSNKEDRMAYF